LIEMTRRTLTVLAGAGLLMPVTLLLGGCDYFSGAGEEAQSGDASGEVLAPSVSDSMIPTDDLTSQPPALREDTASGGSDGGGADSSDDTAEADDSDAPTSEEAAPAPAAEDAAE
jgi:hypothetical protein